MEVHPDQKRDHEQECLRLLLRAQCPTALAFDSVRIDLATYWGIHLDPTIRASKVDGIVGYIVLPAIRTI